MRKVILPCLINRSRGLKKRKKHGCNQNNGLAFLAYTVLSTNSALLSVACDLAGHRGEMWENGRSVFMCVSVIRRGDESVKYYVKYVQVKPLC